MSKIVPRLRKYKLILQVGEGRARPLIYQHSVKTRAYFGNTSMEAEMGFLMAGQALVSWTAGCSREDTEINADCEACTREAGI